MGPTSPSENLKKARRDAGFRTAREAVEHFGGTLSTYAAHESGQRGIRAKNAAIYAKSFGVPADLFLEGSDAVSIARTVQVVGYIGAGIMYAFDAYEMGGEHREIEAPPGMNPGSAAVVVRGDSMTPVYNDGDHIIYNQRSEDVASLVGGERIVWLDDGRTLLKQLLQGTSAGLYTLISHNADPIGDVKLMYAARIEWVKRA